MEEAVEEGWVHIDEVTKEALAEFLGKRGRRFYQIESFPQDKEQQRILLWKKGERIPESIKSQDGSIEVVPFRRGEDIWSLKWKN